ncbi:FtsL-like putative cell division protein [Mucilaginibacter polytrichastri]|uniref:Cell division protein FtsL n=1 Tax=Mucilaginibacter polytrichastri TaxID=1302689 RepID=A0A1Q6A1D6_9SPHI|nr:FtsL-like putative cell division protein [Mucilaginibacter polytrichastri]OKS87791.1 hypothetical protein RG47T_3253 [Mucilaginibacter polytrichastri]SFT26829.1 hypothetical protein SAMN04487890_12627 [Mucilaginibacter polytrichastri]
MNRLIADIAEEEAEKEVVPPKPTVQKPESFFSVFLRKGFISTDDATRALPFILYLSFLAMLYIANRHLAEKNLRDIDKYGKEVKELSWDFKSTKAELAFKSTLTEVAKRADTLGVRVSLGPPQKIVVKEEGDK